MRQLNLFALVLLAGGLFIIGCSKDDLNVKKSEVELSLTNPTGLKDVTVSNIVLAFKEVNSGKIDSIKAASLSTVNVNLPEGSYELSLDGDIRYSDDGGTYDAKVRGYQQSVVVKGNSVAVSLNLFLYNPTAQFVLKEIFFTGTVTPQGKTYNGDKYFIIYNNSEDTLYADGLIIAEAGFLTTTKRVYTPDIMDKTFTAGSMVMVPGTGKQYPVLPGKQLVVANNAINHKEFNPNSLDLRTADFELTLLPTINVDNPEVKDLINLSSAMTMHNRGFKSYVLARLGEGITVDQFKADYYYEPTYVNSAGNVSATKNVYKIPNAWIMDAVNLSVAPMFEWILTAPSLDMGWSYCGKVDSDETRYSKVVKRKVLSTNPDGRVVLKDTNNSTNDFEPEAKPSLMP